MFKDKQLGVLEHLKEEISELEEAIRLGKVKDISGEIADVFILTVVLAGLFGLSIFSIVSLKLEVLKKREWLPPDEKGIMRHRK